MSRANQMPLTTLLSTADGVPLKVSLRRAQRRQRIWAMLLVTPLLLFILASFVVPVLNMAWRGVDNSEVVTYMPKTTEALQSWDGEGLPNEATFAALAADLKTSFESKEIGKVARRLNYERQGMRSLIMGSARKARKLESGPYQEAMLKIDEDWGNPVTWRLLKRESHPYTFSYLLAAIDAGYDDQGDIAINPPETRLYMPLFSRTLILSTAVTILCILLGYPVAYLLANLPLRTSNLLMILVLLPFWTSLLVRTTTWIAILQTQGVLNDLLVWLQVIDEQGRIQMIFNKTGTLVAMTHILLPFMILPLFSVMKTVPPSYLRAARSLGATPLVAFWKVYVPQTISGIGAGSLLVFILSIGYFITPALVGGQSGQLISNMIAYHMQRSLNWGLAGALGVMLLAVVLVLYAIYNKLIGIDKMKMG